MSRGGERSPPSSGGSWIRAILIAGGLFLGLFLLLDPRGIPSTSEPHGRGPPNVRRVVQIAAYFCDHATVHGAWPALDGTSFVLSLVASGQVRTKRSENLAIFFLSPPEDLAARIPEYEALTMERLASERFPHLTDWAGRRNTDPRYRLDPALLELGGELPREPVIGGRLDDDRVIIGFHDGYARILDRDDLGLGPDDPLVFGEASRSELLRKLSDE